MLSILVNPGGCKQVTMYVCMYVKIWVYIGGKGRTVVAPPSSVVKCLWEVFVWGFGVLFLLCVSVSGMLFSVGVCV